jgi:hypothetical protein
MLNYIYENVISAVLFSKNMIWILNTFGPYESLPCC